MPPRNQQPPYYADEEPLPVMDNGMSLDQLQAGVADMNGVSAYDDPAYAPEDIVNAAASMEVPATGMSFDFNSLRVQSPEDFDALPEEQKELLRAIKRGVQFTPQGAAEFILGQQKARMDQDRRVAMMQADPVRQEQTRKLKTEADIAEENRMKMMQKTFDTANYMDDLLEKVKTHPGRSYATGKSSILPKVPGTEPANFQVLLDQLQGQQFMQAYETLKGGGQITEVEGRKATEAMARMNPRQSEEAFLQGVNEFQSIVRAAKERAAAKIQPQESPSTPAAQSAAPRPSKTVAGIKWEKGSDGKWYQAR
jgi:hypothetical protein